MNSILKFHHLIKHKSFTKAAESLHISQSALSQSIINLEKKVGSALILRTKNGIKLTPKGKELFNHSRSYVLLQSFTDNLINKKQLVLSIGMIDSVAMQYASLIKDKLKLQFPEATLQFVIDNSTNLINELINANLHVAIVTRSEKAYELEGMNVSSFGSEKMFCYTNKNIAKNIKTLKDLKDISILKYNQNSNTYKLIDSVLKKKKIEFKESFYSSSPELILQMINNGEGIGFLPEYYERENQNIVRVLKGSLFVEREFILLMDNLFWKSSVGRQLKSIILKT